MADRPPSEIARETLKQLATRRLPPTPDNYLALYDEIAGTRSTQPFPEGPLSSIQRVLPAQTPAQKRLLSQFERAIITKDWTSLDEIDPDMARAAIAAEENTTPGQMSDALMEIDALSVSVEDADADTEHEEALWGDDCPDSDSLRSHVHQLRQVIDKPFDKALLHTMHGVGYRLSE